MKLSDYVRQTMRDKNLTLKAVELKSHGRITGGYINDLVQGKSLNPSVEKLQALAIGLGVSEEEIFRIARGLVIEGDPRREIERLTSIAYDLPEGERTFLVEIGMMMLNRHRAAEEARAAGRPEPPPEPIPQLDAISTRMTKAKKKKAV